ncbi:MAG: hypothetical protein KAT34_07155 [Candidatus Aminicenantes bacterium]|nr:hypothetical protein [Candidatus Aminicenantes bacterium]
MIKVDIGKCTGCRMCETACSFFHTGAINRHMSRIKVIHHYGTGVDGPVLCRQCEERYCMDCPSNALSIGALGQVIASPTLCTLCKGSATPTAKGTASTLTGGHNKKVYFSGKLSQGISKKCERNCPIGAIEIFNDIVYVCDLCGGSPRCVAACSEGALSFVPEEKETISLQNLVIESKKMNPTEKRSLYIAEQGQKLRDTWRN